MSQPATEGLHPEARGLQDKDDRTVLETMLAAQTAASNAARAALPDIARAAEAMHMAIRGGGRAVYVGAGSSGLIALADGLELPGTFGIPRDSIALVFAGGQDALAALTGGIEDDEAAGRRDMDATRVGQDDFVILVSASGSTPYTLGALRSARDQGAGTIVGMASEAGAPLLAQADIAIALASGPEVVSGSTRLGAGVAQKVAIGLMSTLVGLRLGHVHDGHMVNLVPDNAKLESRAIRAVAEIGQCSPEEAAAFLKTTEWRVKTAVLLALGAESREAAEMLIERSGGRLDHALRTL